MLCILYIFRCYNRNYFEHLVKGISHSSHKSLDSLDDAKAAYIICNLGYFFKALIVCSANDLGLTPELNLVSTNPAQEDTVAALNQVRCLSTSSVIY